MSKATFPETSGFESSQPQTTQSQTDMQNVLSALFQMDFAPLRVKAQSSPDMTVLVNSSVLNSFDQKVWLGTSQPDAFAGGNSPTVTAPISNPRIDILCLNSSSALVWVTGSENASPVADWASIPEGAIPLCLIYCRTTMDRILDYDDKDTDATEGYIYSDVRPFLNLGGGGPTSEEFDVLKDNVALLAFKLATEQSLSIFDMVDGFVDTYTDETGIDTTASLNESYDSTNDLYSPSKSDETTSQTALSSGDASGEFLSQDSYNDQYEVFSNVAQTTHGFGMTFTPTSANTITGFKFRLSENNTTTVRCKARLYATSSSLPTGSALAESAEIDPNDWEDWASFALATFTFTTPYTLTSGVEYAVVLEHVSGTPSGSTNCFVKTQTGNPYSGGWFIGKSSGGTWANIGTPDLEFYLLEDVAKENLIDDDSATSWKSSENIATPVVVLHGEGSDESTVISDSSVNARAIVANGNAQIDTAQYKYGSASIYFDGSGDYISITDGSTSTDWDFGTGDFTIEFYARISTDGVVSSIFGSAGGASDWMWFDLQDNGDNRASVTIMGNLINFTGLNITNNTWYHFALCRSGSSVYFFKDGTQVGSTGTNSSNITSSGAIHFGSRYDTTNSLNGWLDEIRVIKGFALYTSTFTPPTAQHGDTTANDVYVGCDLGSSKTITEFSIKQADADKAVTSVKVQASTDNSTWVDIATQAVTADTTQQNYTFSNSTGYRYWRLLANSDTTDGDWSVTEIEFMASPLNMTLISEEQVAEVEPTTARLVLFEEDVDASTINTDILAYATKNNGTDWDLITLTDEGDYGSGKRILTGEVALSGSGTNMAYKIVTANNKNLKIHGASLSWA